MIRPATWASLSAAVSAPSAITWDGATLHCPAPAGLGVLHALRAIAQRRTQG